MCHGCVIADADCCSQGAAEGASRGCIVADSCDTDSERAAISSDVTYCHGVSDGSWRSSQGDRCGESSHYSAADRDSHGARSGTALVSTSNAEGTA